ncbi:MAG: dihydrodipicolinate synthase family protein [Anaerolineae bacterium]|nr:dihydrodipicolinate synthase family protein [Anaerolineae bacterium]
MCAKFYGAWPALISPMAADGGLNVKVLRELTAYVLDKGIGGLYLCGSTGEGIYMPVKERKQVTEVVMAETAGQVPVIVHVGCVATRDAVELARHSRDCGADGVASILPPMNKKIEEVMVHYEKIAASVPDTPFYPYLFGGQTDAVSLMAALLERVPNVGGAKYTGPSMYEYKQILDLKENDWTIFAGMDPQVAFAAMFGGSANIGTTLNYHPGIFREIHKAVTSGDFIRARDLQIRANRVTQVMHKYGLMGALRIAMLMLGFDVGGPRWPTLPVPDDQVKTVQQALEAVDFIGLAQM